MILTPRRCYADGSVRPHGAASPSCKENSMKKTMKAAVFVAPGRIELQELLRFRKSGPPMRCCASPPRRSAAPTCTSSRGNTPCGPASSSRVMRTGGHHREARQRRHRLQSPAAIASDHALWAVQQLPRRRLQPVRRQGHGRLATGQHHRRLPGRVRIPVLQANLTPVPDGLTDEEVLM